jgi:OOP family OmpA-OmpF porin
MVMARLSAFWATGLLGATLLVSFAAKAAPVSGLYIGLGVGGSFLQDQTVNRLDLAELPTPPELSAIGGSFHTDVGPVASASVGYGFGNGLRLELQGDYRRNNVTSVVGDPASGHQEQYGAFVNALYDFDLTALGWSSLTPYLGVGAGYEFSKFHGSDSTGTLSGLTEHDDNSGQSGGFAVQAIVGLSYDIAAVPGLALTAEYRFTAIPEDLGYRTQFAIPAIGLYTRLDAHTNGTFNHAGLIGLRYAFGATPPPPAPAPPPAAAAPTPPPARSYLVFFDWDRADLTDRARQIIAEAAENSTKLAETRIDVNGYTDTSGTPAYNLRLSLRRAQAVAAELVRDSVPRNIISIQGLGETHLLVPTGPGIREPQNRRVEIILH